MSEVATVGITLAGSGPRRILRPGTMAELVSHVRERDGHTLVPIGGGNHLDLGGAPDGPWDALDVSLALRSALSHQEDDLTVVVGAGIRIGEVQEALLERGQRLPIDPPLAPGATLGGVLASGVAGPLRSRFGLPRDLVLGMTTLRADGELVRAGGRVVKNVTGYDLMRLWCGSLGTLGVITEVALRVYPAVPITWMTVPVRGLPEGGELVERVYRADIRPEVADVLIDGGGARVVLGVPTPTAAAVAALTGGRESDGSGYLRSRDTGYGASGALIVQATATPSRLAAAGAALHGLNPDLLVARPLVPLVRASWSSVSLPERDRLAAAVRALRSSLAGGYGFVTVERMPDGWHSKVRPWGEPEGQLDIMRRLKAAYDPDGRFARGRFAGGI